MAVTSVTDAGRTSRSTGLDGARELAAASHAQARDRLAAGGGRRRDGARADHRLHLHPHLMTPRLLDRIDRPQDLHALSEEQLAQVAEEVRGHIIDTVGEIGGHFGANLGTCELAVALHSLLDSPRDKILWDVGHQAYPHKILTGRRDQLATIRQYEGLAPFCSIAESEHDIMGAGHASTAIGYAVGLKEAMRLRGEPDAGKVVAVVGDGAMTGGVAFEAIHHAGGLGHADRRRAQRQRHVDRAERRRALALLQPRPAQPEALARPRGRRGSPRRASRSSARRSSVSGRSSRSRSRRSGRPGCSGRSSTGRTPASSTATTSVRCGSRCPRRWRPTAPSSSTSRR